MTPQSPSNETPWDLTQFSQWPSAAPSYLPESHWQSEISSLSKVVLVLGNARSPRAPNLGCSGAESWDSVMPEQTCCRDEAASHQLSMTGLLTHRIVSVEEYSNLTQNLMQIHWSTCSVILNVTATQYTCSLDGVYCPHWPVKLSFFMSVHSSPLSLTARLHGCRTNCSHYINNDWTSSGQTKHIMHRWQTQGPGAESSPLPSFMQPGTLFLPCGSTKLSLYC